MAGGQNQGQQKSYRGAKIAAGEMALGVGIESHGGILSRLIDVVAKFLNLLTLKSKIIVIFLVIGLKSTGNFQ